MVPVLKWQKSYHRTAPRNKILAYLRETDELNETQKKVPALKLIKKVVLVYVH